MVRLYTDGRIPKLDSKFSYERQKIMPDYIVEVTCMYPVSAVNAEDAFSTIPIVVKFHYINGHVQGKAAIRNTKTNRIVLKAELKPADNN